MVSEAAAGDGRARRNNIKPARPRFLNGDKRELQVGWNFRSCAGRARAWARGRESRERDARARHATRCAVGPSSAERGEVCPPHMQLVHSSARQSARRGACGWGVDGTSFSHPPQAQRALCPYLLTCRRALNNGSVRKMLSSSSSSSHTCSRSFSRIRNAKRSGGGDVYRRT